MNLKERIASRAARKLVKKIKKEDILIPLREETKKLGLVGGEQVDAALKRIEASGFKEVFDELGITREDIEEVFLE